MPSPYDVSVAGATFEGRQAYLARLYEAQVNGARLFACLLREPDNRFDSNAIAVGIKDTLDGLHDWVGFLPKHLAAKLAPQIDAKQIAVTVTKVQITRGGDPMKYGARLTVETQEVAKEAV